MILSAALLLLAPQGDAAAFGYVRYSVSAGSRVGFRGSSTIHDFEGSCAALRAELHADLAAFAATAGGAVSFRVADLATGDEDRDENMRGDLEAGRFPEVVFRLDRLEGALPAAGAGAIQASGTFSIHGVERSRAFPAEIERLDGGRLRVRCSLVFLQSDHGIEPHSTFGVVRVHDEVEAWCDLVLEPVPAATRAAVARLIRVRGTTRIPGAEPVVEEETWRLWTTGDDALLDASSDWLLAGAAGEARVSPAAGARAAPQPDAESAFVEARARLASLESKLAAMGADQRARAGAKLEEAIDRLRLSLASAPAAGGAELRRADGVAEIVLGGKTWARFEGLAGEEPFPAALAGLPNLPAAVRATLRGLRGVPRSAEIHMVNESGERVLSLVCGEASAGAVPVWALDPASWTAPAP